MKGFLSSIRAININSVSDGSGRELIPELFELKQVQENNLWHKDETSVLQHVEGVVKALDQNLNFEFVKNQETKTWLKKYFQQKIDHKSHYLRRDLIIFVSWLHDLGKKETIKIVDELGNTKCPGHDMVSAKMALDICARFDLSATEKKYIIRMIEDHHMPHKACDLYDIKEIVDQFTILGKLKPKTIIDLTLLAKSDMEGSNLVKNEPNEFNRQLNIYEFLFNDLRTWLRK